jgi:hypothetical protein
VGYKQSGLQGAHFELAKWQSGLQVAHEVRYQRCDGPFSLKEAGVDKKLRKATRGDHGELGESHSVDGSYVGHKRPTFEDGVQAKRQMVTVLVRYGTVTVGCGTMTRYGGRCV